MNDFNIYSNCFANAENFNYSVVNSHLIKHNYKRSRGNNLSLDNENLKLIRDIKVENQ